MIKRILFFSILTIAGAQLASAQNLGGLLNKAKKTIFKDGTDLSADEIGRGLKEALDLGVGEAVTLLSAENGYYESIYKVLLPEEARKVTNKLRMVPGFQNVEDELILRLNRAAELAAGKAKPIFVQAIKEMTFTDALDILMGQPDAATRYLERTTSSQLYNEFKPIIANSLDEVNARQYWRDATTAYNKIPLVSPVTTELDDYVTQTALKGMFGMIEKKEENIRQDIGARTSPLLQQVFAKQDK